MSHMVEKPRSKLGWSFYLKLIITVVVLGVLGYFVNWGAIWLEVKKANPRWFAVGTALSLCAYLVLAIRWWLLMKVQKLTLTYGHTLSLVFIGQFFSAFLMGANGGDVMKIFYAIRATPDQKAKATMTIVVDRLMGSAAILIWILCALPFEITRISDDPDLAKKVIYFKIALVLMGIGAIALFFTPFHLLPSWCHRLWLKVPKREFIAGLHADSQLYLRKWPLTLGAFLGALAVHGLNFSACYCLAKGFGMDVSFAAMVLITAFTVMAAATPTSIGGHGVREGVLIAMFKLFQVIPYSIPLCIAFSFTFYLLYQFSWSAVGGVVYLFYHHQVKKEDGEAEAFIEATQ